ncbi:MAG: porin PorA family protein [Pyrinomonadaceae bacterium]
MRKKVFIAIGLVLVGLSAFWRFGLAPRLTDRIPKGWSWETNYIGFQTNADPVTQKLPEKDATGTYSYSFKLISERDRPRSVEFEVRYIVRDVNTGQLTFEYNSRATVDPQTGKRTEKEYQGDYFVFPRNAEKKKTYKLRFSYLKGIPVSFQSEEVIDGLETYLYSYQGRGEYTEAYQGSEAFPGLKVEPGQELKCADDLFNFKVWVEPVTGAIIKIQEGCPSGDYVYDVASGRQLYPVDRWGGETAGDDVVRRAELARRERARQLRVTRYIPLLLLLMGLVCFGWGVLQRRSLPKRSEYVKPQRSIATKWLAFQVAGFSLILIIIGIFQYRSIRDGVYEEVERSGQNVSQAFREMLTERPELFKTEILEPIVLRFDAKIPAAERVSIIDPSGRIIADSDPHRVGTDAGQNDVVKLLRESDHERSFYQTGEGKYLRLSYPLEGGFDPARKSNVMGVFSMSLSLTHADQKVNETFTHTMLILTGFLIGFWVLQYVLVRRGFLRWLHHLTFTAARFGDGDYSARALVPTKDEIGQVAVAFNEMATEIEKSSQQLQLEITERKQIEEKLKTEGLRLAEAQRIAQIGSWEWDIATNKVNWSDELYRIFGLQSQEFAGTYEAYLGFIHPDDRELVASMVERAMHEKKYPEYDHRIMLRDGTVRVIHASGIVITDESGVPVKMTGTAQDITERKRIEEALAEAAQRERALIDNALDVICSIDAEGRFAAVSPACFRIWGYRPEELIGRRYIELVTPEDVARTNEAAQRIMSGEAASDFENRYQHKNGSLVEVLWAASWSEKEQLMFCVARDNTERKRMEKDLEQARDAALETARLKSEFLANMSHEIRTPMNGVIGMTGLLLDTELTDEQRDFTETVRTSADSLLTIINDILDFSKIEAGKLQFETLDFDLRHTVETTIELLAESAQAKGLELASLVDSNVPTMLRGDAGRLRQVMTNLVGNAVKFTDKGEVIVRVTKIHEDDYVTVRVEVSDTGIGITQQAARGLFQAFMQADGSTTRKYGGTGLGLAISKQLVEQMGGEIGIESEPGKGSTFWFTARLEKQVRPAEPPTATPPVELRGLRVLVVDDNATNRRILMHQTASWGMIAEEAEGGTLGLESLRAAQRNGAPYDVVLLDSLMPDMDGLELARAIKADAQIAAAQVVLMPSFGTRGDGQVAREAGIAAYLMKPVRQSQLFDCLATVMSETVAAATPATPRADQLVTRHSLEESKSASRTRILIAEDNPVNQKVAVLQLRRLGYRADVVGDGLEVLEALAGIPYDIVLMDCQMPLMDGFEATREIRRREGESKHTVIIAMTANALEGDRDKCLAAGMDDYLSKPIKVEDLRQILDRWQPDLSAEA